MTPDQRTHAKRLAYALLYGMGPYMLAGELGVSIPDAIMMTDSFKRSLPGVDDWLHQVRPAPPHHHHRPLFLVGGQRALPWAVGSRVCTKLLARCWVPSMCCLPGPCTVPMFVFRYL